MIGVVDLIQGKQAWETTQWSTLTPALKAFRYFPTKSDWDARVVAPPFTCHQVESSRAENVSVNHLGSVEDTQTHIIWTYIIFGKTLDARDVLARADAEWRDRYRAAHLLHLRNSMSGGGGIQENPMGEITPVIFDLFGVEWVGIKVSNTITVRQNMPTGN